MAEVLNRLISDEAINLSAILSVLLMMVFLMAWQVNIPLRAEEGATSATKWKGRELGSGDIKDGPQIPRLPE